MKKLIVLCALTALLVVASAVGCRQQPQPVVTPSLTIMVESNIVKAGSSFMVSGSNFKPNQTIQIEGAYSLSDSKMGYTCYTQADGEGLLHQIIEVPEDTLPGDYEVSIFIGEHFDDRELIATLSIRIQAREK